MVTVDDIKASRSNALATGPFGSDISAKFFKSSGIPVIRGSNLSDNSDLKLVEEEYVYVTDKKAEELESAAATYGDLIFTCWGTISQVGFIDEDARYSKYIISNKQMKFTPDAKLASGLYLFYLFLSEAIQRQIRSLSIGTSVPGFNLGKLRLLKFVLPQLDEQRTIASALSDIDGMLGVLGRLIAKKRDVKLAVMQQLLTGQTRLPGFSGEWTSRRLEELANIQKGAALGKSHLFASGRRPCILYGELFTVYGQVITAVHNRTQSNKGVPSVCGDVLMPGSTTTTGIDLATASALLLEDVALGGDIIVIRRKHQKSYNPVFMAHYLTHVKKQEIAERTQGITIHHLYGKDLRSLPLRLPPLEEQVAIANVCIELDAEIAVLEQRREKALAIKQGMMQELLSGQTRLVKPQAPEVKITAESQGTKGHNWAINEAVVIATLVKHFGSETFPLGRKRYTKFSYLLHRHAERVTEGYLKKAAGPYNPQTKYAGPEKIAQQNGYIKQHKGPKGHSGFIAADSVAKAEEYFEKWYGSDVVRWLEQFRFKKNDELEVLATVDMAVQDLRSNGKSVDVAAVKDVIDSHPEWKAKLDRPCFADHSIDSAIQKSEALFG